jgi:hypothetical protein
MVVLMVMVKVMWMLVMKVVMETGGWVDVCDGVWVVSWDSEA